MILVTGATGTVGSHLVRELRGAGVPFRAFVRDPKRGKAMLGPGVEIVEGDYAQAQSIASALVGVERVFLIAPLVPELAQLEANVIHSAARSNVQHIVKLSTLGVIQDQRAAVRPEPRQYPLHRESEERLERSDLAFTHLRPGPFMQNLLNFAPAIANEGVFYGSWGEGRMGYVDVRDVAAVAARALTEPGHEGKAYSLTGPEALSLAHIAERISVAIGREVRYVDVPIEASQKAMLARGIPEWMVGAMGEVMAHARGGGADMVADGVMRVTRKPPRSFDDFAREFAPVFRGGSS
jgi:uncharacterized protein YbjT (DUF2867 family)